MTTEIQPAIDAGKRIATLEHAATVHTAADGAVPFVLVPNGLILTTVEKHLAAPLAKRAEAKLDDTQSFVDYVNRFKDAGTLVFADLDGRKFAAVLDYHEGTTGSPRWGRHNAKFECKTSTDWNRWFGKNNTAMSQVEFALFIEEGIPNIAEPAGADLLTMCLTLEAKKDVSFRSSMRLDNGQNQIKFEETIDGKAGGNNTQFGTVEIPKGFVLAIEPFRGVGLKRLEARFRYRINDGVLKMWFELVRPEDVLRAAFEEVIAGVRTGLGEVPVLAGALTSINRNPNEQ